MSKRAHDDVAWLPATEQLTALDAKDVSSVELVELPDGDELTPTMKLKRKPIAAKYAAEIEALYQV